VWPHVPTLPELTRDFSARPGMAKSFGSCWGYFRDSAGYLTAQFFLGTTSSVAVAIIYPSRKGMWLELDAVPASLDFFFPNLFAKEIALFYLGDLQLYFQHWITRSCLRFVTVFDLYVSGVSFFVCCSIFPGSGSHGVLLRVSSLTRSNDFLGIPFAPSSFSFRQIREDFPSITLDILNARRGWF